MNKIKTILTILVLSAIIYSCNNTAVTGIVVSEEDKTKFQDQIAAFRTFTKAFYDEDIDWITSCTKQSLLDIKNKGQELHPGIFVGKLSSNELSQILDNLGKTGAEGLSIFSGKGIKEEHFDILRSYKGLIQK